MHPTILAMMAKERQAQLLREARGIRMVDPYWDHRSSLIRRVGDRIMIALSDVLIAIGMQMKKGRGVHGEHLAQARAAGCDDEFS